jgi:trk system potassium uptake protein TrkA
MSLIEEATGSPDTIRLVNLARAGVNLIETTITGHSRAGGRTLAELRLPPGAIVAAVVRGGVPNVPNGSFRLEVGDEVLVVSESATEADVQRVFQE